MEYPPPIYLIMLSLSMGHITFDEASKMISLRKEMEEEKRKELDRQM